MTSNPFALPEGTRVIVTAGASGIGRAVSAELVRRGDTVIVADVNAEGAGNAAAAMSGPGSATPVTLDVTDAAAVLAPDIAPKMPQANTVAIASPPLM